MTVSSHSFTRRGALALGAVAGLGTLVRSPSAAWAAGDDLQSFSLALPADALGPAGGAIVRAPAPFDLLGLSGRIAGAHLQVRTRARGGAWSRWLHLSAAADHAPDGGRRSAASDPIWTGRGRSCSSAAAAFRALRIHFVGCRRPPARAVVAATRSALTPVSAHGRRRWSCAGWATSRSPPQRPSYGRVDMAFVHTHRDRQRLFPGGIAGDRARHRPLPPGTNGWSDIGTTSSSTSTARSSRALRRDRQGRHRRPGAGVQLVLTGISCIGGFMTAALPTRR